jgi:predicted nucleotidyltransferase
MSDNELLLEDIKHYLDSNLPGEIQNIILFGSRVSGEPGKYSDYDVLVILKHDFEWNLKRKIFDLAFDIGLKMDILIDVKVLSANDLNTLKGKQSFVIEAMENGISI